MNLKRAKNLRKSAHQIAVKESTDGNIVLLAYKEQKHPPKAYYRTDGSVEMMAVISTNMTTHDSVRGIYRRLKKLFKNGNPFK